MFVFVFAFAFHMRELKSRFGPARILNQSVLDPESVRFWILSRPVLDPEPGRG